MKILVLDIETTGFLKAGGSIVEVGIVSLDLDNGSTTVVLDTLLREDMLDKGHKNAWIFENSDLTFEEVLKAPAAAEVFKKVQEILDAYPAGVTAYNKDFDFTFLRDRGLKINDLDCPMKLATDILKLPNQYRYANYKWPKVQEAYDFFFLNPEGGNEENYVELHRGADDALHEAKIVYELHKRGYYELGI